MTIISGVLLVVLWWWWNKERDWRLLLIIVGGSLNFIERLIFGYVRDYWQIPGTNVYNNINDWIIFIGVGLYLWKKLK